ncbi:MAG: hypothetical protein ACJAQ8_002630 [Haliea salexigens]|jgi:hypothetical protein
MARSLVLLRSAASVADKQSPRGAVSRPRRPKTSRALEGRRLAFVTVTQ